MKKNLLQISLLLSSTFALAQQNFCTPTFQYNADGNMITNVKLATIDNTSPFQSGTTPNYEDFTSISTELYSGETYEISIKGPSSVFESDVMVYFDFNQNGNFDDTNESFYLGRLQAANPANAFTITANITIPDDALVGETRMRILKNTNVASYSNPDAENSIEDACDQNLRSGQAEDYTVIILGETIAQPCEPVEAGTEIGDLGCVNLEYQGQLVGYTTVRAADGNIWLQQNLGSSQVATSIDDETARGDYFQWGRWDDGHQLKGSEMSEILPVPNNPIGLGEGTEIFYIGGGSPYTGYSGWFANPAQNDTWTAKNLDEVTENNGMDPCKAIGEEWEIPTENDWDNVMQMEEIFPAPAGSSNNGITRGFESNLKIAGAGARKDDSFAFEGQRAYIWTKSASTNPDFYRFVYLGTYAGSSTGFGGDAKSHGYSIRCVKKSETMFVSDLNQSSISIYPNPTNGIVIINTKEIVNKVEVYSLNGQKIKEENSKNINLTSLSKGVYLIKITLENKTQKTFKIIKN